MRSTTRQQAGCDHLLDRGDPREQAAMVLDKLTRQERILERILERQDRQERFLERIMDRLLDEPGPPEPFEWTDDADEEPQTQTAGGGDDPPDADEEPQTQTAGGGDDPPVSLIGSPRRVLACWYSKRPNDRTYPIKTYPPVPINTYLPY